MTVPFADKCSLRIPYPNATTDDQHFENYKEISRWADNLRRDSDCLPSGGCSEAFSVRGDVWVAANSIDFQYDWKGVGTGGVGPEADEFFTSGVSGIPTSGTFTSITLPAGMWQFTIAGDLDTSSSPTSGYVGVGFTLTTVGSLQGYEGMTPYTDFLVNAFNTASMSHTKLIYSPDSFDAEIYFSNQMDVQARGDDLCWSGVQIPTCGTLTVGT